MIKLYKAFISDFFEDEFLREEKLLEETGFYKTALITNPKRKRQSLAGYILLRRGIKELFGRDSYKVFYNENSKPLLNFCDFSIAHTDNLAVCAFSDRAIGIDAEQSREIKDIGRMRFFCENENRYIYADDDANARFLRLWTKKEAYVKMLGGTLAQNGGVDVSAEVSGAEFSYVDDDRYIITVCEALY